MSNNNNSTNKGANVSKVDNDQESSKISQFFEGMADKINITKNNSVKDAFKNLSMKIPSLDGADRVMENFSAQNSSITKFLFILVVFIIFVLLFRFGSWLLTKFLTPSKSPIILDGMTNGRNYIKINVNPSKKEPKPIFRSINQNQGMEFTWSTWVFVENVFSDSNEKFQRVFAKGGDEDINHEMIIGGKPVDNQLLNVTPGLFLESGMNKLVFVINTYDETIESSEITLPYETIEIDNVPMQKWVCCTIRVQNKTVDIYINGVLTKRVNMTRIPKQNYGNIHVGGHADGFNGYVSALRYFDYAIGNAKIQDILQTGPNLKLIGPELFETTNPPYLSMKWYLQ
jgi:hypothetical protein